MPFTILTVSQLLSITDAIAQHVDCAQAALDAGKVKADLVLSRCQADMDPYSFRQIFDQLSLYDAGSPAASWFGGQLRLMTFRLEAQMAITGKQVDPSIVNLDSFATWYNAITPYQCLFSWEFAAVYFWAQGKALSPANVYCPGGTVNAAYNFVTGYGQSVNQSIGFQLAHGVISGGGSTSFIADNGGAVPSANVLSPYQQGYSPVIPEVRIDANVTCTGGTLLRFTGLNQAGVSKTWDAVIDGGGTGAVAGTIVATTPQTGGDRMRSVSSVVIVGSATAGNWSLRVRQESGRPS